MPKKLEDLFHRAQVAEQQAEQKKQERRAKQQLEEQLKKRELLLAKAKKIEEDRAKAAELLEKGKEMTARKKELTREMREFMRAAQNSIQEYERQLADLNKQIETIEAHPAIIDRLREQAEEENRRIELEKEFTGGIWIKPPGKEIGETINNVLRKNKEYNNNVAGMDEREDPLYWLKEYLIDATGMRDIEIKVRGPFEEAKDAVRRWSEIRKEAESGNPDVQKIDGLLAEFLYKRLKHFVDTFDQRVEQAAQEKYDYYRQNRRKARAQRVEGWTVEKWKQCLRKGIQELIQIRMPSRIRNIQSILEEAERIMREEKYKAKLLAQLGEKLGRCTLFYLGGLRDPFAPDNLKEPQKQKEK